MKRKVSSLALMFLSMAVTLHLTDQAARRAQESPVPNQACQVQTVECTHTDEMSLGARLYYPGGLGAIVETEPRGVRIVSLLPNHAADKAGLKLGDRITRIDGEPAINRNTNWAVGHLRGKIGTPVQLEVERGSGIWQRTFRLELERENIETRYSVYSKLDNGTLIVRLLWLDGDTANQLARHLCQASDGAVDRVVLDLQNVSYGETEAVAQCASLFLGEDVVIGYTQGDYPNVKSVSAPLRTRGHAMTDLLTTVEVGPYTAKTGELLARALIDNLDVEVSGDTTAGLGTLDRRTIRSRASNQGHNFQLLDAKGIAIEGHPIEPSFWSWSNLLSPVPAGME